MKLTKTKRNLLMVTLLVVVLVSLFSVTAYAAGTNNVSTAVNNAFDTYMKPQIMDVVNHTVLVIVDGILAIFFIIKIVMAGVSYHKNGGQFEWHVAAIFFAGLIISLSAPLWIWSMIGWK